MQYKLPSLLTQHKIKLVVIDSIAALFRVEFTESQAVQRAQLLRAFGAQLRKISKDFSVAVVCVNQVRTCVNLLFLSLGLLVKDLLPFCLVQALVAQLVSAFGC